MIERRVAGAAAAAPAVAASSSGPPAVAAARADTSVQPLVRVLEEGEEEESRSAVTEKIAAFTSDTLEHLSHPAFSRAGEEEDSREGECRVRKQAVTVMGGTAPFEPGK